jgi:hypothetical protein
MLDSAFASHADFIIWFAGSKFVEPENLAEIKPNTAFTVRMAVRNMDMGNYVNPQTNYFAAPQQLNAQGVIVAHSHVVIEAIDSLTSTKVTDPNKFAFFQGFNAAAKGGEVTATVTNGLPAGVYKISSINASANHAHVAVPIAQHGSLDDTIYITVGGDGKNNDDGGKKAISSKTASTGSKATSAGSKTTASGATKTPRATNNAKKVPRRFASREVCPFSSMFSA